MFKLPLIKAFKLTASCIIYLIRLRERCIWYRLKRYTSTVPTSGAVQPENFKEKNIALDDD